MFLISALYQRATLLWKRLSKTCLSSFEFPTSFINENPSFIMLQPKTNAFKSSSKNFMRTVYIFKCTILSLNGNLKKRTRIRLKFYLQIKVLTDFDKGWFFMWQLVSQKHLSYCCLVAFVLYIKTLAISFHAARTSLSFFMSRKCSLIR